MRTLEQWFVLYAENHQDKTNKMIHWVCVPLIFWSVIAFLWGIPTSPQMDAIGLNWSYIATILVLAWYAFLSLPLAIGMLLFCYILLNCTSQLNEYLLANDLLSLQTTAFVLFILAWIGQFIGHKIEGKKPSFLTDLSFLLIGPFWLLHFIYKKLNIRYT